MPAQLLQIAQPVKVVERATAFYRDVLGCKFLFSAPPSLAFFDLGGVRLLLGKPEGPGQPQQGSVLYLKEADVPKAHATLLAKGCQDRGKPHVITKMGDLEVWLGLVEDSEGNVIGLMNG